MWCKFGHVALKFGGNETLTLHRVFSRVPFSWQVPQQRGQGALPHRRHLVLNPQPSTLNSQPSTHNPQPSTLNPQPSIPNPKP